jgi:hypothetical protein
MLPDWSVVLPDWSVVLPDWSVVLPDRVTDYDAAMVTCSCYVESTLHLVLCPYVSKN